MPTTFTRRAGLAAIACPLALLAGMLLGGVEQWTTSTWTQNWYFAGNSAVLLGLALLIVALLGLRARHSGAVGLAGLVLAGVGTLVVLAQLSWTLALWLLPTGVGCAVFAAGIVRARLLSRVAAALFGSGLLLTAGLALHGQLLGEEDATIFPYFPYGLVGVGVFGVGLTWLGWQLRAERPVDTGQGIGPVA